MKVAILVILYKCEIDNSQTVLSLLSACAEIGRSDASIRIWNNGPSTILGASSRCIDAMRKLGLTVEIVEDLENSPLSKAYNKFIDKKNFDKYLILDQDSNLSAAYLSQVFSLEGVDLLMPGIRHGEKIESPTVKKQPASEGFIADPKRLMAIGSGLCLSRNLCDIYISKTGSVFDENYALYGVDTSFFFKLRQIYKYSPLVLYRGAEFNHSLSRLEKEGASITKFRSVERAYDLGISIRRYPSIRLLLHFGKVTARSVMGSRSRPWFTVVTSILKGRHPRC